MQNHMSQIVLDVHTTCILVRLKLRVINIHIYFSTIIVLNIFIYQILTTLDTKVSLTMINTGHHLLCTILDTYKFHISTNLKVIY